MVSITPPPADAIPRGWGVITMKTRRLSRCGQVSGFALGLAVLAACGPAVSSSTDSGAADGTGSTGSGASTSSTVGDDDEGESTERTIACGDGIFDPGEWCYDRVTFDPADEGRIQFYRLISTETDIVLWDDLGMNALGFDGEHPALGATFFPINAYYFNSLIQPANLSGQFSIRSEFVFHQIVTYFPDGNPYVHCNSHIWMAPPPIEPVDNTSPHQILDTRCERDDLITAIDIVDGGRDDLFTFDRHSRIGTLYRDDQTSLGEYGTLYAQEAQRLDDPLPCPPSTIHAGDVNADGYEDAIVAMPSCDADPIPALYLFRGTENDDLDAPGLRLDLDADLTSDIMSLDLADFDADGFDDVVLAESGTLLFTFGNPDGLLPAAPLSTRPVQATIDGPIDRPDSDQNVVALDHGLFTPDDRRSVVVSTDDGLQVVASDGTQFGLFPERAGTLGVQDLNNDGVSDLALIAGNRLVVYVSNP